MRGDQLEERVLGRQNFSRTLCLRVREILRPLFLSISPGGHETTGHMCGADGIKMATLNAQPAVFKSGFCPGGHSGSKQDCSQRWHLELEEELREGSGVTLTGL